MPYGSSSRIRRGVALFEVVLAAVLLGIGLSVTMSLAATALSRQGLGEHNLTAAWLADEQLSLVVMEGPKKFIQTQPTSGDYEAPFEEYSFEVEVRHISDYEPYEVTVFITWDGGNREFILQTKVAPLQGEPEEQEDRTPLEPIDRETLYFEESES